MEAVATERSQITPHRGELVRLVVALAWRYLLRRRTVSGVRSGLRGAVFGIALSLVPLMVVMVVADGLIDGIVDRYLELGSYHAQVAIDDAGLVAEGSLGLVAEFVAALPGTAVVIPERRGSGLLASGGRRVVAELRAVPEDLLQIDPGFAALIELHAGEFDLSERGVVVSVELARRLQVEVGDDIHAVAVPALTESVVGNLDAMPPLVLPRVTPLRVSGVFSSGYQELDRQWVFVSSVTGQRALPVARPLVGIKVADPRDETHLSAVVAQAQSLVGQLGRVRDWRVLEGANLRRFDSSRTLLLFVVAMIVAIATVNVASATVSISLTRRKEVAYLKAMGLPPSAVFASLTLAGTLAGVAGAVLGVGVGLAAAVNINEALLLLERAVSWLAGVASVAPTAPVALIDRSFYLESIPFTLPAEQVAMVAAATVALATVAAAIPALSAARLRPQAALARTA